MTMREIGGYFGLEEFSNKEYHSDLIALNLARNALLYLLKARNINKLYIPYYLCDSIKGVCEKYGYAFDYYNINTSFLPEFSAALGETEYLYIVNYFGQIDDDMILKFKERYSNIIIDNAHAFFQKPVAGIDTIYSCRKFFGVPYGAYLSTTLKMDLKLDIDVSKDRMTHQLGRYETLASNYYPHFLRHEESLNDEPLKYMSKLTHNILRAIDYDRVKRVRNDNYAYLDKMLGSLNKLKLTIPDGAFAYPLLIDNGMSIKKTLAEKKIYIPTLWPNVLIDTPEESIEQEYAKNILSLPCDQRYGINEMKYMLNTMKSAGVIKAYT